jgi:uncharacterized protein involved in exopolysaccharide biosynthesis
MAIDFLGRPAAADSADEPGFRITLPQVRSFLRRYVWVIAGVFVCTVVGAYATLSLTTEKYDVNSALLVKLGRENLDAPATARNGVLSTGVRREELGSEVQILQSRRLLEDVVDELGVEAFRVQRVPPPDLLGQVKFYAKAGLRWVKTQYTDALIALDLRKRLTEREEAVALLTEELIAEPQKDADVIALRMRLADPTLGVRIQETLIDKFLAHRVDVRRNRGVREFFANEVNELRTALQAAEAAANAFRQRRDLTVPSEQKALLLRQIRELSAQRVRTNGRVMALTQQVTTAGDLMGKTAERIHSSQVELPSVSAQQLRERLVRLESERAKLLTTYMPGASPVKIVEDEIASVNRLLATRTNTELGSTTTEINPVRQQLEQSINQDTVALQGLRAELGILDQQLAALMTELRQVDAAEATLIDLDRERALLDEKYRSAVQRLTDAQIDAELDVSRISNVTVAVPPAASLGPVYPRKLLLMALALAIGLVLGIAVAIAMEWSRETMRDAEEVEAVTELVCLARFDRSQGRGRTAGAA